MCGISGYIGKNNATKILVENLEKLEYRGYDSSGLCLYKNKDFKVIKSLGSISKLKEKVKNIDEDFAIGIGHTRWATHGKPSQKNAHPHLSNNKKIAVVHNGIIENYKQLKNQLICENIFFNSDTDTEVISNLLEKYFRTNFIETINIVFNKLKGSFALAILNKDEDKIYFAKNKSPLYIGIGKDEVQLTSDISTFFGKLESYIILEDGEFGSVSSKNIEIFDKNMRKINKKPIKLEKEYKNTCLLNEKYYMSKEINEIPNVLKNELISLNNLKNKIDKNLFLNINSIEIIACGTAYHAGLMGSYFIEKNCRIPCHVFIASEFKYSNPILSKNNLYVFISQSGETADTISCAELVKNFGCKTLAFTNVEHCTLNNIVDFVIPICAGKEVAVASTKAFTCQVFAMLFFSHILANDYDEFYINNKDVIDNFYIENLLGNFYTEILKFNKIFFVGRQGDYYSCSEASLKLKEITYINCMAISAGELKHGSLALIDGSTLVIVICTNGLIKEKINSNIEEILARGGKVALFTIFEKEDFCDVDYYFKLKNYNDEFNLISSIIPFQQLAFYVSLEKGYNPDKPRNLAKSVTVE